MTTPIARILFFDTETTGLIPRDLDPEKIPYIIQLSFIEYDLSSNTILKTYNEYINIDKTVVISDEITTITGITREKCNTGVPIQDALIAFYGSYLMADAVVAHNISFDKQMILNEYKRHSKNLENLFPLYILRLETQMEFCTMRMGLLHTNFWLKNKNGKPFKKNPKLNELYETLFETKLENAHDALVDTTACMNCFIKMYKN